LLSGRRFIGNFVSDAVIESRTQSTPAKALMHPIKASQVWEADAMAALPAKTTIFEPAKQNEQAAPTAGTR